MAKVEESRNYKRMVAQETLILEATEAISELIEKVGIDRSTLAKRMHKTKGFVSQLLNDDRNMTLRTLSDMAFALGYKVKVSVEKIDE